MQLVLDNKANVFAAGSNIINMRPWPCLLLSEGRVTVYSESQISWNRG
jgi:hypothetical protein